MPTLAMPATTIILEQVRKGINRRSKINVVLYGFLCSEE
jgi:hypothetical protein